MIPLIINGRVPSGEAEHDLRIRWFIERNLTERISLAHRTSRAYISKFHFHRMFRQMVGETVMQISESADWRKRPGNLNYLLPSWIPGNCGCDHGPDFFTARFSDALGRVGAGRVLFPPLKLHPFSATANINIKVIPKTLWFFNSVHPFDFFL